MKATIRGLVGCAWLLAACITLHAQADKTITVVLLDGKTGDPVTPSNYVVRINRHDDVHNEWLKINDDGTAQLTLPDDATLLSVEATYDSSMETYINCDAAKEKDKTAAHWYAVADIRKSGIVAPNECGKSHENPKAGVFTFFVRKRDWRDLPSE